MSALGRCVAIRMSAFALLLITLVCSQVRQGAIALAAQDVALPKPRLTGGMSLEQAIASRRSVRSFARQALPLASAGQLLWAAQGVTDAKRGLRTAPSAGALYPLHAVLVAGDVAGLKAGAYEYVPGAHALTLLVAGDLRPALCTAALGQTPVRDAPAVICLLGDYAVTRKKYGARAERYVHLEAGHAGQDICLQAVALGLGAVTMGAFDDDGVRSILGAADDLTPLYLIPVGFASK